MSEQQKDQWKKDAEQLKKDLDQRETVIQRNEVELKMGDGVPRKPTKARSLKSPPKSPPPDDYLRSQINWNS